MDDVCLRREIEVQDLYSRKAHAKGKDLILKYAVDSDEVLISGEIDHNPMTNFKRSQFLADYDLGAYKTKCIKCSFSYFKKYVSKD